ncbi:MAG: hypothetical protein NT088_02770 [Candidatus Omnitrophica bacterium]|nr:hypothetical protein [Candidatus Omnitrophota bacterium]
MRSARNNKGQGTIETVMAFIILVIVLGGMVNIWFWFNNQMIKRQVAYNNTRVTAGTGKDDYIQPVSWNYVPEALTENKVIVK